MTEHTKEPWSVAYDDEDDVDVNHHDYPNNLPTFAYIDAKGWGELGQIVVRMEDETSLKSEGVSKIKRIVACVNALADIEDPEAFILDLKELTQGLRSAYVDGDFVQEELIRIDEEHLKGDPK